MRNSLKAEKVLRLAALICIAIGVPVLIESIYLYLNPLAYGGGYTVLETMPAISDEVSYYNHIKSMLSYGRPLGYYGYDGQHAMIGTFGAWGWLVLLPHFMMCKVLGFHLYSGTIINIILFAILIFLYGYLFKKTWIECIFFGILLFAPFTLYFFDGWLMEGVITFWGILSAMFIAYIGLKDSNRKFIFLVVCIVVLAALSKVTWSILSIPLVLTLCGRTRTKLEGLLKTIVKIVLIFLLFVVGSYSFYRIFSAPYFVGNYGTDNVSAIIKSEGVFSGILKVALELWYNLGTTFSFNENRLYNLCMIYIIFSLAVSLLWIYLYRKDIKKAIIPALVLGGFVVGVITLYDGGIGAIKTITPAATFALVYIFIHDSTVMKKMVACGAFVLLCGSFVYQYTVGDYFTNICTDEKKISLSQLQEHMNNIVVDSEATNCWDNTVAFSVGDGNPGDNAIMLLPAGAGIMLYQTLPDASEMKEKYVFLTEANSDRREDFLENGYCVLDEFDGVTLLGKQSGD